MSLASSPSRNATTPAADPRLTHLAGSTPGMAARFAGVSIVLGSTAFTRTPLPRTSAATACASATTAAFDAAYAAAPALVAGATAAPELARDHRGQQGPQAAMDRLQVRLHHRPPHIVARLLVERLAPAPGSRDQ